MAAHEHLSMALFAKVIPTDEWPTLHLGGGGEYDQLRTDEVLHTTQTKVSREVVDRKKEMIQQGGEHVPAVEVATVGGRSHLVEGHHTLAAYRELGLPPHVWRHLKGPDYIAPPKYRREDS